MFNPILNASTTPLPTQCAKPGPTAHIALWNQKRVKLLAGGLLGGIVLAGLVGLGGNHFIANGTMLKQHQANQTFSATISTTPADLSVGHAFNNVYAVSQNSPAHSDNSTANPLHFDHHPNPPEFIEPTLEEITKIVNAEPDLELKEMAEKALRKDATGYDIFAAANKHGNLRVALYFHTEGAKLGYLSCMDMLKISQKEFKLTDKALSGIVNIFNSNYLKEAKKLAEKATASQRDYYFFAAANAFQQVKNFTEAAKYHTEGAKLGYMHCMNALKSDQKLYNISDSDLAAITKIYNPLRQKELQRLAQQATASKKGYNYFDAANAHWQSGYFSKAADFHIEGAKAGYIHCMNALKSDQKLYNISDSDLAAITKIYNPLREKELQRLAQQATASKKGYHYFDAADAHCQSGYFSKAADFHIEGAKVGYIHCMNALKDSPKMFNISDQKLADLENLYAQAKQSHQGKV